MDSQAYNEESLRQRRRQRLLEAKRKKQKQMIIRKLVRLAALPLTAVLLIILIVFAAKGIFHKTVKEEAAPAKTEKEGMLENKIPETAGQTETGQAESIKTDEALESVSNSVAREQHAEKAASGLETYAFGSTSQTSQMGGDIISNYGVIVDLEKGEVLAGRNADTRMNPASMTKILTVLVAAEHVKDLEEPFTITRDITDYSYVNDCSNVGFEENETVTVRDLFYGTILSSGADAAAGLAIYTAGSLEKFVDMMNDKLNELGLSETAHFTNCVGIYDKEHYCTVTDMAVILAAAIDNELCKEVLSAHTYTTTQSKEHPEGLLISNWFLRRIEDKDAGGEVLCGKTGYVVQSGNCAASYAVDQNGKGYICVTADANSGWRCIYDHVALFKKYIG